MIAADVSIDATEIDAVLTAAFDATGVPSHALVSPARSPRIVHARWAAAAVLRQRWGLSYPELGRIFGGRDHGTMHYGVRRADPGLVAEIADLVASSDIAGPMPDAFGRPRNDVGYCRRCGLTSWHWAGCPEAA